MSNMLVSNEIDKKNVCRFMGYGANGEPSPRVSSLIDEYIEHAHHLIEPSYSYDIREIKLVESPSVFVEGSIVFSSEVVAGLLDQCQKVVMFVVTIGNHLEEMVTRLGGHNNMLESALLDAVGSNAVERVADSMQSEVAILAHAQGMAISRRFSPGYCDWDIRQQKILFRALNADLAGVHLTDRCLMIPQKSISGIIGLGPFVDCVEEYNPCKICDKIACFARR